MKGKIALNMKFHACLSCSILLFATLASVHDAKAQEYNALADCRAQSLDTDEIHACMDGYLDTLDTKIQQITDFLGDSLSGETLDGLLRAQQAFEEYRRDNCLWYLDFSLPRKDADQIAKNCLADISRARLQELEGLVNTDTSGSQTVEGFYLYSETQNYFQPCGRAERFWVDGEAFALSQLQQNYLTVAEADGQLLYSVLAGKLNNQVQSPEGYRGVLQLDSVVKLRVPSDGDCSVPVGTASFDISDTEVGVPDTLREVFDDELSSGREPEQQLTAYFGDWIADCIELDGDKSCKLEVVLMQDGLVPVVDREAVNPKLVINRAANRSTFIQVIFPGREIESPTLVRWQIDQEVLGDIVGSKIRVDQYEALLLINESEYLVEKLMPMLQSGNQIIFSVQESIDDGSGDTFTGTLQGLSKSLNFVDDFMSDNG